MIMITSSCRCETVLGLENDLRKVQGDLERLQYERKVDKNKMKELQKENTALNLSQKNSLSVSQLLEASWDNTLALKWHSQNSDCLLILALGSEYHNKQLIHFFLLFHDLGSISLWVFRIAQWSGKFLETWCQAEICSNHILLCGGRWLYLLSANFSL